jgi:hypothetical protein
MRCKSPPKWGTWRGLDRPRYAVDAVDLIAQGADVVAGVAGAVQELHRRRQRARGGVVRMDAMTTSLLARVLAQQLPRHRIEQAITGHEVKIPPSGNQVGTQLTANADHLRTQPDRLRQEPELLSKFLVRSGRVELPQHYCHQNLNLARLPVPPRPRGRNT